MVHSRNKGKRGELELAAWLKEHGYEARRGQQFKGGTDSPDVVCDDLGLHIECKRVEAGNLYNWLEQAIRDADPSKMPVVLHRKSKKGWVAILRADDLIKLIRGF